MTRQDAHPPWYRLPSAPPVSSPVVIVGAGLAGCWLARELAEHGCQVHLLDAGATPASPAHSASANPVGVVKPYVTRDASRITDFYREAYQHLQSRLLQLSLSDACRYTPCGVLQLVHEPYADNALYTSLDHQQASELAGLPLTSHALWFQNAGWLNPGALCRALVQHPLIAWQPNWTLNTLTQAQDGRWQLVNRYKQALHSDCVVLANGHQLNATPYTCTLPVLAARGQITRCRVSGAHTLNCVISGKHYAIPEGHTVVTGATFERGLADTGVWPRDDERNRRSLASLLPTLTTWPNKMTGYAGVRATTPDRLPVLGPVPDASAFDRDYASAHHGRPPATYTDASWHDGLYVLGGLGSRGIVTSAYCAYLLAAHLNGSDRAWLPWIELIHPARFAMRALRRRPLAPSNDPA